MLVNRLLVKKSKKKKKKMMMMMLYFGSRLRYKPWRRVSLKGDKKKSNEMHEGMKVLEEWRSWVGSFLSPFKQIFFFPWGFLFLYVVESLILLVKDLWLDVIRGRRYSCAWYGIGNQKLSWVVIRLLWFASIRRSWIKRLWMEVFWWRKVRQEW